MSVIVCRYDERGMIVKKNDDGGWCSSQKGGKMKMRLSDGKNVQDWDYIFIVVEDESRIVQRGW
jgi:hypothetical protein